LRFVDQAPEGGAVDDAVAVARKFGTRRCSWLRKATAARLRRVTRVWLQGHAYFVN
jgi:hypothetical protein